MKKTGVTIKALQVGKPVFDVKKQKERELSYSDLPFQGKEWLSVLDYLPNTYDLCVVETEDEKKIQCWHTGCEWDGLKYKGEKILTWKRYE